MYFSLIPSSHIEIDFPRVSVPCPGHAAAGGVGLVKQEEARREDNWSRVQSAEDRANAALCAAKHKPRHRLWCRSEICPRDPYSLDVFRPLWMQLENFPPPRTWSSTMSSGYSSLEEDSEEYFFTARTSFFKKPSGKPTESKNVEKDRERRTQLSGEEIRQKVEQYNTLTKDHLKMTLIPSGEYTGFIKVQLELRRPVTVRGGPGPGGAGEEAFYLPRGSTNTLHISSNSTVQQVIVALLKKSKVADNPAKYALYKRYSREEHVYVCKLAEVEKPLYLRLVAGPDADTFGFVLREQQTGEVMWEAFSIPELMNFLRFLEKEEKEHAEAIVSRYDNYRQKLQEALRANQGAP